MSDTTNYFIQKFQGVFSGILRWKQLTELWQQIQDMDQNWYIYQIGEEVPKATSSAKQLGKFINHLDQLLRIDHNEDYCGIVYVDDKLKPSFIKIYDPNNLGSSCGSSSAPPPLPGWIISLEQPVDLQLAVPRPANRQSWWKNIFSYTQ